MPISNVPLEGSALKAEPVSTVILPLLCDTEPLRVSVVCLTTSVHIEPFHTAMSVVPYAIQ